jgi:outer membrane protein TolC
MIMRQRSTPLRRILLATVCAGMAGCASFSTDGGYAEVRRLAQQRSADAIPATAPGAAPIERQVAALLAQPLSAEDAVGIALLNNRGLQAGYAELGIAEADLVQAGRLANPVLSFGRMRGHDGIEIERKLMLPVIGLLTMPLATRLERRRYAQAQLRAAGEVLRTADATRRAWYGAVAAQQSAAYMEQVLSAAEASAELARRMALAGNWSKPRHAREQAFYADSVAQLARARQTRTVEREKLTRLLGVASPSAFTLPARLPELPAAARALGTVQTEAIGNRLDLLMAQKELAGLASSLGLTRATGFVNLLDLSYLRNDDAQGQRASGYEIELQIPLFDWGGARLAKAEALYMQAVHRAAGAAIDAGSQVRESYGAYRTAYDLARHYRDEVVPLKKRIADEQLLRYNGMLISVFELLADAREQVVSVNAAIEAQRDYWLADAALQAALSGSGDTPAATPRAATQGAAPAQH